MDGIVEILYLFQHPTTAKHSNVHTKDFGRKVLFVVILLPFPASVPCFPATSASHSRLCFISVFNSMNVYYHACPL